LTKKEFTDGNYYPDNLPQLAAKLHVPEQQLVDWFEKRRNIWKKELAAMAYRRMAAEHQSIQEKQQLKQRQQLAEGYFSVKILSHLDKIFRDGKHYPYDLSHLAVDLHVPEQQLVDWFEKRRDIWKKEQATMAYSRMAEH